MRSSILRSSFAALTTLTALSLPACIAQPIGDDADGPGSSTHDAWTEGYSKTLDPIMFNGLVNLIHLQECKLSIHDNHGVMAPSLAIVQFMTPPGEMPNVDASSVAFDIPPVSKDLGTLLPTITGTIRSFDVTDISAELRPSDIHVKLSFQGSVHVHASSPYPDADVVLDPSSIDMYFTINAGALALSDVKADIHTHGDNCGFLDWCDSIVTDLVPNLNGYVKPALTKSVNAFLANPTAQDGMLAVLLTLSGKAGQTPPFAVQRPTVHIDGAGIEYKISRELPPIAPTGLHLSQLCGNTISATTDSNGDAVKLQRASDGVNFVDVPYDANAMYGTTLNDFDPPGPSATYRACAYNFLGTACGPTQTLALTHSACGGPSTTNKKTGCTRLPNGRLLCSTTGSDLP